MKKVDTEVTDVTGITDKTDVTAKSKPIFRSAFATHTKVVFESVFYEGKPHFLCYPVMGKFVVRKEMVEQDIQILPLRRQMFPYEPYSLNKESLEKLNQEELIAEKLYYVVLKEYDTFLALEDKYKNLNSTQTFETYQQHKLTSTSYLYFKGEKDSGKTRALEVHYGLDYRPLLSPSLPSATYMDIVARTMCHYLLVMTKRGRATVYRILKPTYSGSPWTKRIGGIVQLEIAAPNVPRGPTLDGVLLTLPVTVIVLSAYAIRSMTRYYSGFLRMVVLIAKIENMLGIDCQVSTEEKRPKDLVWPKDKRFMLQSYWCSRRVFKDSKEFINKRKWRGDNLWAVLTFVIFSFWAIFLIILRIRVWF